MRFVKPSEYFENWADAYEATVEIWQEKFSKHPFAVVASTVILVPLMLVMCLFGLRPGDNDE